MRIWEEEKLARDVYAQLARTSGLMIFRNISRSESQHMQAVSRLVQSGNAARRLADAPGVFSFPDYQQLYEALVAEGSRGPMDALTVGARIEEMDIADLQKLITTVNEPRTRRTLQRLLRGSEHHLQAFSSQIRSQGGTYQARYLSQQEFDRIAGEQGQGQGQSGDRGQMRGGRRGSAGQGGHQAGQGRSPRFDGGTPRGNRSGR